jgi:hypothetical protein
MKEVSMSRSLTPRAFSSTLAVLALLACGGSPQGAAVPAPAGPTSPARNVLTGTCKDYDLGASTMDVIAGVSFALREITFKIHENTEITIRNRRAGLSDMRSGMVLRIEYRETSQGNLADKIELVMDATGLR